GPVHRDLSIEAPGAQKRRIEDLRPVGGGKQNDAGGWVEAVQLDEKLIQRLFLLVISTAQSSHGAACAAERVQLVDKDDARRLGASLFEQIPDTRRAHA